MKRLVFTGRKMKKLFKYGLTTLFALVIALLILIGNGTFGKTLPVAIYADLCDAFFVPGILILLFGLLIAVSNGGAFDMLKFGMIKLFDLFKRDLTKVKYRTFYDYKKSLEGKERSFRYLLIVGAAVTAVSVVFFLLYLYA